MLKPFAKYALGEPFLSSFTVRFYQSDDALTAALQSGDVEAASGLSPDDLAGLSGENIDRSPLNRVFGVFFNQNQSAVLRDHDVRQALADSVDQNALVEQVLDGYATPLYGPVPPEILASLGEDASSSLPAEHASSTNLALAAQKRLLAEGWVMGSDGVLTKTTGTGKSAATERLEFSLATGNVPELRAAAEYLKEQWGKVGVQVDVQIFDQGDLSQNVIRPRKYDALLFGEVVGRELDLFAFWDSSQRNDRASTSLCMQIRPPTRRSRACAPPRTRRSAPRSITASFRRSMRTSRRYFSMRPISCIVSLKTSRALTWDS